MAHLEIEFLTFSIVILDVRSRSLFELCPYISFWVRTTNSKVDISCLLKGQNMLCCVHMTVFLPSSALLIRVICEMKALSFLYRMLQIFDVYRKAIWSKFFLYKIKIVDIIVDRQHSVEFQSRFEFQDSYWLDIKLY